MDYTESELLEKLYKGECKARLRLIFRGTYFNFNLEMIGRDKQPDCCIANYDFGIFVRTEKGLKCDKYTTIEELKSDCANKLRTKGIEPVAIILVGDDFSQRIPLEN